MTARVLITEAVNAPLDALGGIEVDQRDGLWRDRTALLEAVGHASGLIVRNQTAVDRQLIAAAGQLRVVGRLGAGLDNIDLAALGERGIEVVHGGGLNAHAVAEYVIGAALDLSRRLARSDREVRAGTWTRHLGHELRGRVLGVVGLGATGAETARLGMALGMRVIGFDPYLPAPEGIEAVTLSDLTQRADVLSVHVPLLEGTRGLIGAAELAALPPGAIVINASRGGIIDEEALLAALEEGGLGGAALDVRSSEPPPPGDRFRERSDVLLTAHIAGLTVESQVAIAAHVLAGVRRAVGS